MNYLYSFSIIFLLVNNHHFDQPHHLIVLLVGVDGIRAGVILIMTPLRIRSRFNLSSDDDTVSCQDHGISWVANTRPVNELNSFICERWILSDLHLFHHRGAQEGDSWALCSSPGSCLETLERAHCQCSAVWGWSKCVTLSEHCGG